MTSLLLTIAGQTLRISGEALEVEIDDDSELNGIADLGAVLDDGEYFAAIRNKLQESACPVDHGRMSQPVRAGQVKAHPLNPIPSAPPPSQQTDDAGAVAPPPAAAPAATRLVPRYVLRPYCKRPELCGGYGKHHCGSCERVSRQGAAA